MQNAIEQFKNLLNFEADYDDFCPTAAGEPYHDALFEFCRGRADLAIPELGIDFTLLDSNKTNMDNCEGKLTYDQEIEFRDEGTGKEYVLSIAIYKAIDTLFGAMSLSDAVEADADGAEAERVSVAAPAGVGEDLVQKLGACFTPMGRELCVDDALSDAMHSPYVGSTLEFGGFTFRVTAESEEVTDESDAWSLGEGYVQLTEVSQGFTVEISTSLFIGQCTEIQSVTIQCGDAVFELEATD